ncbi:hypothetical protein X975_01977, partial [Stegodyphus mimosarum]
MLLKFNIKCFTTCIKVSAVSSLGYKFTRSLHSLQTIPYISRFKQHITKAATIFSLFSIKMSQSLFIFEMLLEVEKSF